MYIHVTIRLAALYYCCLHASCFLVCLWQGEGVRVFIQLYKEVELAIGLGSEYCQSLLRHKNIVVGGQNSTLLQSYIYYTYIFTCKPLQVSRKL